VLSESNPGRLHIVRWKAFEWTGCSAVREDRLGGLPSLFLPALFLHQSDQALQRGLPRINFCISCNLHLLAGHYFPCGALATCDRARASRKAASSWMLAGPGEEGGWLNSATVTP
jgi:hypothetical protein